MSDTQTVEGEVLRRADMTKPGALERFQDRGEIGRTDVMVSRTTGGMRFDNIGQMMEFAKMMALSDIGVPKHLRGNPGACLRITIQADAWGFDPFSVADKSYAVGDRISYESQLVHAVVERRAPLDRRLRMEYRGEGPTRRCKVIGRLMGEETPFEWEGPEFQQIKIKNSPEWSTNPDKQLWYHASRDWARIYVPDVLLGVYTRDEIEGSEWGPNRARQVEDSSGLASRLPETRLGGFDADGIARTLAEASGGQEVSDATQGQSGPNRTSEAPKDAKGDAVKYDKETGEVSPEEMNVLTGGAPVEPTDRAGYTAWAEGWIKRATDKDDAMARYDGERELRANCKVTIQERKRLEKLLKGKFEEGDDD